MPLRIAGDELEQDRIRLERDIANTVPSPPSMSPGSLREGEDDVSSVDLPRHNSNPRHSFQPFDHSSHFDSDFYSRHGDEDSIAIDPELGLTMSTAAHHASALTLSAGLHGRNYTPVKTRQEFDPQRPLQPMLKTAEGMSMFDSTVHSKTQSIKSNKHDQRTFDPIIVDSTAELDRFLKTGFRQPNLSTAAGTTYHLTRSHSQPEPRIEVDETQNLLRSPLSLSQALGNQFSPKRPRSTPASMQSFQFPKPSDASVHNVVPKPSLVQQPKTSHSIPTKFNEKQREKVKEKENKSLHSALSGTRVQQPPQPQSKIQFQEPIVDNDKTPRPRKAGFAPEAISSIQRPPLVDKSNRKTEAFTPNQRSKLQVHLPDITGLTAAVASPLKGGEGYLAAKVANRRFAADVVAALDGLQSRLETLERENSVSRRRVKELEVDLEECKVDVAREKKRMRARELEREADRDNGKEKNRNDFPEVDELRYRDVVDEKKTLALEAFVVTMREHVARLTSELALHRSLINGLRQDVDASDEIQFEVQTLNTKVERLSGEVERLKMFVEEGVRERQRVREASVASISRQERGDAAGVPSQVGIDITYVTNPLNREDEGFSRGQMTMEELRPSASQQDDEQSLLSEDEEEPLEEPEEEQNQPSRIEEDPASIQDQPIETTEQLDSRFPRYIDDSELARVQSEILERRSERSMRESFNQTNDSDNNNTVENHTSPTREPSPAPSISRFGTLPSRNRPSNREEIRNMAHRQTSDPLPSHKRPSNPVFTEIRGSRMERLFFAAPEHNKMTCHVCHRRKRRGYELAQEHSPEEEHLLKAYLRTKGADREWKAPAEQHGNGRVPPQTILTRVLHELEDDFSHYKAIYLELAEQYAVIDAVSNVAKRNVLADHLREVIDTLEQKGDQIAALYELLHFQDKPLPRNEASIPPRNERATFA
ncbi:hypothetical protein Clacol_010048 [Clathrus columnatus]|uniref:Cep57 centrosome microtubule-binding domain-containing protein n=1 Tax=Clathrus columnatus TaxID=1419009 RepID=A0AAV5ASR0_9AGAM|nr:hypothetical protein Clacol_010048 [Clathrus columnatus]